MKLSLLFLLLASLTQTPTAAIDLNTAPVASLIQLPGIGPAKARAIVRARKRRPFRRVRDLLRVKGIGRKTLRRLRPFIRIRRNKRLRKRRRGS